MPFAQQHYPFENAQEFQQRFPADFIAEGIDQTRGWFYTLLVISTALFNKAPFKNLIANGLVLAADGQKMSKRKKNYPDPMEVVHKYGADALRLYLINSPVVRAENLRFKEDGVRDIIKDVFLPWYNAYRFLFQNVYRYVKDEPSANQRFQFDAAIIAKATNVMDVWILSFKESLVEFVACEMKAYRLYTVVPRLTRFIDQLTNWYVRLNRRRIKGELGLDDCVSSLNILYDVLNTMVKLMAPFTPYLSEYMYQRLVRLTHTDTSAVQPPLNKQNSVGSIGAKKGTAPTNGASVHLEMMPKANRAFIQTSVEMAVSRLQSVVELGRVMRDRKTIPTKYPVPEVVVIHKNDQYLRDIRTLESFILGELNARKLTVCADKAQYGVKMRAEPDHKTLGLRLKGDFKTVMAAIKQLNDAEIQESLGRGHFEVAGKRVELDEVRVIYAMDTNADSKYEAHSDNDVLVLMDFTPTDELLLEGLSREIINRVQKLKKKAQLLPTDPVVVYHEIVDATSDISKVAKTHQAFIEGVIKSPFVPFDAAKVAAEASTRAFIDETCDIKGVVMKLTISMDKSAVKAAASNGNDSSATTAAPVLRYVNIVSKVQPRYNLPTATNQGTVLIEDASKKALTLNALQSEIVQLFGLYRLKLYFSSKGQALDLTSTSATADKLAGETIFVATETDYVEKDKKLIAAAKRPFVKFTNTEGPIATTVLLENPKGVTL